MALTPESEAWIGGLVAGAVVYHFTGPSLTGFLGKPLTAFLFGIASILALAVTRPQSWTGAFFASLLMGYSISAIGDPMVQWTGQAVVSSPQGVLS